MKIKYCPMCGEKTKLKYSIGNGEIEVYQCMDIDNHKIRVDNIANIIHLNQ